MHRTLGLAQRGTLSPLQLRHSAWTDPKPGGTCACRVCLMETFCPPTVVLETSFPPQNKQLPRCGQGE